MKKILFFIGIVLSCYNSYAQAVPNGENISLDEQLLNIPQTTVSSGIIYERVISIANLYNFNKVSTFNTANFPYFKQAFSEMRRASNDTKFTSLDSFKNLTAQNTNPNEVDVAILNTQFNILNYNEESPSSGGLTYNTITNRFQSISGKAPFFMLHNTIIAPAKEHVSGINVVYKLRNDLYFKNGTKTIKTMVADFGDGTNRILISNSIFSNQTITINYNSSGDKISKFVIIYNDDSTLTTYGKIYFYYKPLTSRIVSSSNLTPGSCTTSDPLKQDFTLQADIPFTGYNVGDPTIKAKIDYRIFYAFAHTDKKIRKPIIIIDGFDPGDKRKIEDCDCENIPSCASRNTTSGVFDPQKHRAMKDLMEYYDSNVVEGNVDLLNKLRIEGYDVIVVNHPTYEATNLQNGQTVTIDGGAYYVESNAMALIKLLQQTKLLLVANGSTHDIAIVAPSMAGQISKYALSYMEKKFADTGLSLWKHNTYLWISVDSPHLGSNIPMGDQALLYLLKEGGIDAAADFYDKELSSPAAQQLLIEFHRPKEEVNWLGINVKNYHLVNQNMLNAQTISQNMSNDRGNTLFQQHYNNQFSNGLVGSNGWPQNLRKIALANGSLTGSKETQTLNGSPFISFANDGEKVFNLRGFQRVHIPLLIGSITFRIHIASLESINMPSFSSEARIARFKKLFDDKTVKSPNINPRGNMDNTPGGFFDAQADISDSATSQDPVPGVTLSALHNWSLNNLSVENIFKSISSLLGGSEWYRHEFNPIHSFIPTFSALGHLQPNQNWANPVNTNLTCPSNKQTPFDSYFGLEKNTQHTSFTKESVDWLLKELSGQLQPPNFPIQENILSGATAVCININSAYTFTDICKLPGVVTNWSVSSNIQIISSTDYSIVVKGLSNGQGTITATFPGGISTTKNIWVGPPTFPSNGIVSGPINVTFNQTKTYTYNGGSPSGAGGYQWFIDAPYNNGGVACNWQILSGQGTSTITVKTGCLATMAVIGVKATNICGSSTKYLYVTNSATGNGNDDNGDPCSGTLTVFPNPVPSKGSLDMSVIYPPFDPCDNGGVLYKNTVNNIVKIYDLYGNLVYENKFNSNEISITNLNLKKGHYILNVATDKKMLKQIIIVE
jgi:hypothetical protein